MTTDVAVITIWEVGFASNAPPTKVGTLPAPDILSRINVQGTEFQFSPTSGRLALSCHWQCRVLIWDAHNSKYLLHHTDTKFSLGLFFSPDGCFLACPTAESEIYLWKDSPTGFLLFGTLLPSIAHQRPLLSQNSESIVTYGGHMIQLWCGTEAFPTTPPSNLTQAPQHIGDFVLDLSPDLMLAMVAMQKDNTVRVLDLNSGILQSTINGGMEVYGLGVIKDTAFVIGSQKVSTWNLPIGNGTTVTKAGPEDSSWTVALQNEWHRNDVISASISPDPRHIALIMPESGTSHLHVYQTSDGTKLWYHRSTYGGIVQFSLDGLNVWCAQDSGSVRGVPELTSDYVLEE